MTQPHQSQGLSRRALIAGSAAFGVATLLLPRSAHAGVSIEEILGGYKHAGGDKERHALEAAIDDVVSGLSIVTREVARVRLQHANPIPSSLVLAADKQSLMLAYDSELYAAPLDGKTVKVRSSAGEDMLLHVELSKTSVDQIFAADDTSRTNRFHTIDGKLGVDVIVSAPQLPKALSYRLTYARS
jgi:hypothetical protein